MAWFQTFVVVIVVVVFVVVNVVVDYLSSIIASHLHTCIHLYTRILPYIIVRQGYLHYYVNLYTWFTDAE